MAKGKRSLPYLEKMIRHGSYRLALRTLAKHRQLRSVLVPLLEGRLRASILQKNPRNRPAQVQEDKCAAMRALLHSSLRTIDRGIVSTHVMERFFEVYLNNVLLVDYDKLRERLGFSPPSFLVVAPSGRCNLHCTGCYACSDSGPAAELDFDTFDRILTEKEQLWGSYFTVITGGEPFLWKDQGKDLIDMAAKHSSNLFVVHTNGTLINEELARRLELVGNLTPAISVEGFEQETDERRGKGVHQHVLNAFENLRKAGVPFGISVTGTRLNWHMITSGEFADYYFIQQGATYGWMLQYMPIGRNHTLDLMVTPEQRLEMLRRTWHLMRDKKIFIADFLSSGTLTDGCIAAGRAGGYMYIQWDGDVTPCAFIPYSTHNIYEVYRNGGNLNTLLNTPLMWRIREWQNSYGYAQPAERMGNWFCPCPIRDHYEDVFKIILECQARGIDPDAEAVLTERGYREGLTQHGRDFDKLTWSLWRERYVPHRRTDRAKGMGKDGRDPAKP